MTTKLLSPTGFVTGDASLSISYPFVSHPSTVVTAKTPGDLKWIAMGLPVSINDEITSITLYYQVSNPRSFIHQVRVSQMTTPNQALVVHDDPTDLASTTPTSYVSKANIVARNGALMLELRLMFNDVNDRILLGAVAVTTKN